MNSDSGRVNGLSGRVLLNGSGFTAGTGRARLLAGPAALATWATSDGREGRPVWDSAHIA
jgi:hypothetical protein